MHSSSTFIDAIETLPITGATMRFHATSGGEVQCYNMERSTALKAAYDILAAVEAFDERVPCEVVPIEYGRTG